VTRILAIVFCAALLGACQSPPINVRSAEAVIVQNETTKRHIKSFSDTNRKTQAHVKKVQEEAVQEADALREAKKYLEELLNE
jgi:hypothetical protein